MNETVYSSSETATATAYERLTVTNSDAGLYIGLGSSVNSDFNDATHKTTEIHTDAVVRYCNCIYFSFVISKKHFVKLNSLFTIY